MDKFKFDPVHSKMIVDAIVEGYRDYIEHRKDRHENMEISSAFAWTKGNFIESKIAEISVDLNFSYKKAKAGLTWDYLQFSQGDKKLLFLIKNAAYFNEQCFAHGILPNQDKSRGLRRTYLHELSKINQNIEFTSAQSELENNNVQSVQLSLFVPENQVKDELDQLQNSYNEFHILTYKIDKAFQISNIMHYLPNPDDNIAYRIENLSKYISGADLTDEERDIIAPEPDSEFVDPEVFDIGIFEEEEEK